LNTLLIVVPATVAFAWVFYRFCEKPFMRKAAKNVERVDEQRAEELVPVFVQSLPAVADEA
jgi:peptidoglycan/LPS O-acetylase OafA/YrhL